MLSKKELPVQLSARNQLKGIVRGVKLGTVMAEVVMDVGGQTLTAAITRVSAENLDLKPGDQVTAVIKATEVIVGK
jgi:molybdate transport system regulatory protein